MVRAAYLAAELTTWYVIVPLALAFLLRTCPVTEHPVGLVPALLGPFQTSANRPCPHRLAAVCADNSELHGRHSGILQSRSDGAASPTFMLHAGRPPNTVYRIDNVLQKR